MNTSIGEAPNLNMLWTMLLVEECIRSGVTLFCISPGSRSTPLVAAVALHPKAETIVCLDERAAAFYALGYARATGSPAALICTSGTAVANYLPAVVEAAHDHVPMLILTADRPPELRETGANQTIPQPAIFGEFVRWKFDIPCPDLAIAPQTLLTTIDHAIFRTRTAPKGAVHLNCMFREPLAPTAQPFPADYLAPLAGWFGSSLPWTQYAPPFPAVQAEVVYELARLIANAASPMIVVGRLASAHEAEQTARLASTLAVPFVADIASGLRLGVPSNIAFSGNGAFLPYFDQMLLAPELLEAVKPDAVLYLGGSIVSKRLLQWLGSTRPAHYVVIDETPFRHDPNHQVTMRVQAAIVPFAEMLVEAVLHNQRQQQHLSAKPTTQEQHKRTLATLSARVKQTLRDVMQEEASSIQQMSEIAVAHTVSTMLPPRSGLFLSNSMPIRDMDMYAAVQERETPVAIGTNRGASGIDGIVASAAGFARGLGTPTTLLIGDVALVHDINSLLLVARNPVPLVIIVINNAGGGIFSFLPIATHTDIFEPFWGTPHNADFSSGAAFAGLRYILAETMQDFRIAYQSALLSAENERTSTLLEVRTGRSGNLDDHKRLQNLIVSRLRDVAL